MTKYISKNNKHKKLDRAILLIALVLIFAFIFSVFFDTNKVNAYYEIMNNYVDYSQFLERSFNTNAFNDTEYSYVGALGNCDISLKMPVDNTYTQYVAFFDNNKMRFGYNIPNSALHMMDEHRCSLRLSFYGTDLQNYYPYFTFLIDYFERDSTNTSKVNLNVSFWRGTQNTLLVEETTNSHYNVRTNFSKAFYDSSILTDMFEIQIDFYNYLCIQFCNFTPLGHAYNADRTFFGSADTVSNRETLTISEYRLSNDYLVEMTSEYNKGYNAGLQAGSNSSFMGLMGAVVQAPLDAVISIFDFEILGYNMKQFMLSILTISIIIAIIGFMLGRTKKD